MRTDKAGCGHLFYPWASVKSVVKNPFLFKISFVLRAISIAGSAEMRK